jgi:hypothetical protein
LAPEVLAGDPASARADFFSLGMVVAEAARILHTAPPDLVQRLSASDPEHRPSSAENALSILQASRIRGTVLSTTFPDQARNAGQAQSDGVFARIGKAFRRRRGRRAPGRSGETTLVVSVPQREQDVWLAISTLRSVPVVLGPPSDDWTAVSRALSIPMPQRSTKVSAAHADFQL